MSKQVWLITGAGRGMGADFAKAALAAGQAVVATGRDPDRVSVALGQSADLLPVRLDVTRRTDAEAGVRAALEKFGRIDVLVNNAASFYAGYFEELTAEQFEQQLSTSSSARSTSRALFCPSCASSGRDTSSRSRRPQASRPATTS